METLLTISVVLNFVMALALIHHEGYYKGRCEELEKEREMSGWEDEAKFWRNVYNTEAEGKRIENGSY